MTRPMRLFRRIPASGGAAVLLAAATAALVATPYDGGTCRNVVSAWTVPVASVAEVDRPAEPAGLAEARRALEAAEAESSALGDERAEAAEAERAAENARQAADAAEEARPEPSTDTGDSWEMDSAELDVDMAENSVDVAEDWLDVVQGDDWGFYDADDVADAQEDVDDARAELAEAQAKLDQLEAATAAEQSAAVAAANKADELAAKAEAAEKKAQRLSDILAAKQRKVDSRVRPARSLVEDLEDGSRAAVAEWAHERRIAQGDVVARNAVRDDCRQNGLWRAGVAGADVLLLGALGVRALSPRLRLPWRRG